MQRIGNITLYSPSDLVVFGACRHATALDIRSLTEEMDTTEATEFGKMLAERGIRHEEDCLRRFREQGLNVREIPKGPDLARRAELTREAVREGVDVVYQAAFHRHPWRGDADFLVRTDAPSMLGGHSYEVADAKLAHSVMPKHILQLSAYSDMLSDLQGKVPARMRVHLGDGSVATEETADHLHGYRRTRAEFEALVASPPADSRPEPCSHCAYCRWRGRCEAQWKEEDHLSLVAGMRRSQADRLRAADVRTVAALAALPQGREIPGMTPETLGTLRKQAGLQAHKAHTGEDRFETLPAEAGRGVWRLPEPDPGDVFVDFEGDPLHARGGLVYLFGRHHREGRKWVFRDLWAHGLDGEREAFLEFMRFLRGRLAAHPDAHVYHYNHYEATALKALACRHAACEDQLDDMLREGRLVDLYRVAREAVRTSEPGYGLKNLEAFHRGRRDAEVKQAADSMVVYSRWRESRDDRLLRELADYNREDCESARSLRDWLLTLRGEPPPEKDNGGGGEDGESPRFGRAERARKDWEKEFDKACERLAEAEWEPQDLRERLRDLLEYHNREAKSEWWKCLSRMGRRHEELLEDVECLAMLRLSARRKTRKDGKGPARAAAPVRTPGNTEEDRKKRRYTYRFPEQEHKLREGVQISDTRTLTGWGHVREVDEDERLVTVDWKRFPGEPKRSWGSRDGGSRASTREPAPFLPVPGADPSGKGKPNLSIGPGGPVKADVIRGALYRIMHVLTTPPAGRDRKGRLCAPDLLLRRHPRVAGRRPGEPLARGDDMAREALATVSALDRSCLFIQGPPGAGKTHVSSIVITELLRQKKKVGITSNSHRSIHNLLHRVALLAKAEGIDFKGLKKVSLGNPESFFLEAESVKNAAEVDGTFRARDLVAGTAWLFSDGHLNSALDHLFVEEASQVSLANAVAMSFSAKSLVLVGDQMQLGQPVKGIHPGESGQSALEFLLEGRKTIPADRGLFLAETWRMRPSVCRFVSDSFYDGRLRSHPAALGRSLALRGTDLPDEGIVLVEAEHKGCVQRSVTEGEIVRRKFGELTGQPFRSGDGSERPLTAEDILVVTPYNAQANLLRAMLPEGARVGTIDKFQGQEAPVSIVSMATSAPDDLPRHTEFFYDRNRLNVAISRAQCLAIVVMSPRMLDLPCQTVEQMRLLDNFCRLHKYAHVLRDPGPAGGGAGRKAPGIPFRGR